jgi:hypothetical protein
MVNKAPVKIAALLGISFLFCNPPAVVKPPVIENVPDHPIRIIHGDTLLYQIAFTDKAERERFVYGFNQFLKDHEFLTQRFDSAGVLTVLRIQPAQPQAALPAGGTTQPVLPPVGDTATGAQTLTQQILAEKDSAVPLPPFGGSVRLYCPRGSIEYPLCDMVEAYPFSERIGLDSLTGYFYVANVSNTSLTLKTVGRITNIAGKTVTVLDVVDAWTRYVKEHPAEGAALFRWCEGIMEFICGREAIIRGISAVDNATIRIKLARADPLALERLRSSRALPSPLKLGAYAIKITRENEDVLVANRGAAGLKPFVNELLLRRGNDANPILSFSLGRYDALLLWSAADLDYARRNLIKNGTCSHVGRDRYFISCNLPDSASRVYLRSLLRPDDLLRNFVKAEGRVIPAIESDSLPPLPQSAAAKPAFAEPVKISYRKDDAISKIVAEKFLAACTNAGVQGMIFPLDIKTYESALVNGSGGCAVGWVPETVLADSCEKLRLAAIFFRDETDEIQRLQAAWEIPLFTVDWYLLAKTKVGLYRDKLSGMYVKQEGK